MKPEHLGFLINSALYLAGLIAAGLARGDDFVVVSALLSAAACILSYDGQIGGNLRFAKLNLAISWIAGIAAGVIFTWDCFV